MFVITPLSTFIARFSTKFELFINFIGLIAAAGAGAAQVSLFHSRHNPFFVLKDANSHL